MRANVADDVMIMLVCQQVAMFARATWCMCVHIIGICS